MKTVSIINLKDGVAKTLTTISTAHILAEKYGIDNDKPVMMDSGRTQQTRLRTALRKISDRYDYCLIDNAPDINISIINALVASNDVIIPVQIDPCAFDRLKEPKDQIEITQEELNPDLCLKGCLIIRFRRFDGERQGEDWLRQRQKCLIFKTHIRYSGKVVESSFIGKPIAAYSKTCGVALDYTSFVTEYLASAERGRYYGIRYY